MSKRVENPRELLSSAQAFTDSWADVGDYIQVQMTDLLRVRMAITKNSSVNMRSRLVEYAVTGGTAFIPQIETESASDVKLEPLYKEFNTDPAGLDASFTYDVKGMKIVKLQIEAGTVGATPATLDECKINAVREN